MSRFIVIGSGIVGLSIADKLLKKKFVKPKDLLILDKYSIPSNGTSTHNSGVLHAGLYYDSESLKAKLSIEGRVKLRQWCIDNNLPILDCGKLLVPFSKKENERINFIYKNALNNGCEVEIIDYAKAIKIQPGLKKQDFYLWSPKTAVFNPSLILRKLYQFLKEAGVTFVKASVVEDDSSNKKLRLANNTYINYSRYINCAGAGALRIAKTISNKFDNLSIVPFLGEYGIQRGGEKIKTNIYPVPDPELPFLGIHLTPRINNAALIGPNALPVLRKDTQGFDLRDMVAVPSIVLNNIILFAKNKQNYREHAFSELSLNVKEKFSRNSLRFFDDNAKKDFKISMDKTTYGIRPQLIKTKSHEFVNDFIYEIIDENIHIVNSVSPAFTCSFALAEYIINLL